MTTYNVWVGGEGPFYRSYLAELGYYPLNEAQVKRWVTDEMDTDAMSERLHRDDEEPDGEDDFPHRYEIEDGCLGFGAYTDQTFGVAKVVDGEDEVIWSGSFEDLGSGNNPGLQTFREDISKPDEVGVAYCYTFKGGWNVEIELPDDEEFDVKKLVFCVTSVEELGDIVTSISYNSEDYYEDGSSDGKGCDWYLVKDGEFEMI